MMTPMMRSSQMPTTSTPKPIRWLLPTILVALVLAVLVTLFLLSGKNNLSAGKAEHTAAGLQYRNAGRVIALTVPGSWAPRPRSKEAVSFGGSNGCSVSVLSHLMFVPTSVYQRSVQLGITKTHPGQVYAPDNSWHGSERPDGAVHADLKEENGEIISQNYIHFRRGASVISLIETWPGRAVDCPAQMAEIEESFHLD